MPVIPVSFVCHVGFSHSKSYIWKQELENIFISSPALYSQHRAEHSSIFSSTFFYYSVIWNSSVIPYCSVIWYSHKLFRYYSELPLCNIRCGDNKHTDISPIETTPHTHMQGLKTHVISFLQFWNPQIKVHAHNWHTWWSGSRCSYEKINYFLHVVVCLKIN